jgi:hypothetical protein
MVANYATLEELKSRPRIGDIDDDALLNKALAAASRGIDNRCGRRFDLDTTVSARVYNPRDRVVHQDDGDLFLVDDIGTTTGLVVEIGSAGSSTWTTVTSSNYEVYPDNTLAENKPIEGLLLLSYPVTSALFRLRVTAKWGWPAVPADISEATLIQASRLFARKDSPDGVLGGSEWGVVRLSRVDPDVKDMTEAYAKAGFA